jgi:hypothetical protein
MKVASSITTLSILGLFIAHPGKQNPHRDDKEFSVSVKTIQGDTILTAAAYFDGHIICLRKDNKLFVLDSNFNYEEQLTTRLSDMNARSLFQRNDTVFVSTTNEIFYLDKAFAFKKNNPEIIPDARPYYYGDSTYDTYFEDEGEFGAAVFFVNKKSNKTFSYLSYFPQHILKFNKRFIVSEDRGYISINDPEKLYELKDDKLKTSGNWYYMSESRKIGRSRFGTSKERGVVTYQLPLFGQNLVTFSKDNNLYSIYSDRNSTILVRHENHKVVPIDTLLNKPLDFFDTYTNTSKNISVTAYRQSGIRAEANKYVNYQNTGLVYINGNRITFLEFQTPHMQAK